MISPAHGLGATGLVTFGLGGEASPAPTEGFVRVRSARVQVGRLELARVRSVRLLG